MESVATTNTTKKKLIWGSLIVIIVAGVFVYFWQAHFVIPANVTEVTFSPKWVNQAQFAGIFVAKEKGFYRRVGLEVNIDEFESGDSVLEDITSGSSEFALLNANQFLKAVSEGEDLVAVAAFYQVSPYILASLKSDKVTTPSQFGGKALGVKGTNNQEAYTIYRLTLASAGVNENDVRFVDLPFGPSERDDLLEGRADVIGFYRTRLYQFDKDGLLYNLIYPEQYGAALYNDVLVVRREYLDENPKQVRNFLKATVQGWQYAFANQEEAIILTLGYVTEDSYKDIEYEKFILSASQELMLPTRNTKIGEMDLSRWQRFYDNLVDRGLLERSFEIGDVVTTDYLP